MIVPEYTPSVQTEGPQQEALTIQPRGPESDGVNIAQSGEAIGHAAEQLGDSLTRNLLYRQRSQDQMKAQDALLQADATLQNGHAALLERKGAQAIGITGGSAKNPDEEARSIAMGVSSLSEDAQAKLDPNFVKFDDSSAGIIARARAQLLNGPDGKTPLPAGEAKYVMARFDRMAESYHGRAVNHEAQQTQIARVDSLDNATAAAQNAGAFAAHPSDLLANNADAQASALEAARLQGHDTKEPVTAAMINQRTSNATMQQFLRSNPDMDPKQQQAFLDAMKPHLNPIDVASLQKPIDGKWFDYRMNAIRGHLENDAMGPGGKNRFKNDDGTYNLAAGEKEATDMFSQAKEGENGYHKGEEIEQAKQARSFMTMQNGALKQGWDDAAKGFLDSISSQKQKNQGMLYQDAEKNAIAQFAESVQPGTLEKLRSSAAKTWLGDADGPQMRLKLALSNPDLKRGYEDASSMIDAQYPGTAQKEQKKLAKQNLDALAPQFRTGKQITDWQAEQFSKVKVPAPFMGMLWPDKKNRGEEEDWQRQTLGDQATVDSTYTALQNKIGRAPTTAEMHEVIAAFKSKTDAYKAAHPNP